MPYKDPIKQKQHAREYYLKHSKDLILQTKLRRAKDPFTFDIRNTLSQFKKRYGIKVTLEEYLKLYNETGGVCKICSQPSKVKRRIAIDHCHKTKRVRGLLCDRCNLGLGSFNDDVALLKKTIKYLEENAKKE